MMGPLLSFEDAHHLEQLLGLIRAEAIKVTPDRRNQNQPAFWFRSGWALVHASAWAQSAWDDSSSRALYFGFGHPLNPLLWRSDARLLRRIESILNQNGSRRLNLT